MILDQYNQAVDELLYKVKTTQRAAIIAAANIMQLFAPFILERFKRRKKLPLVLRALYLPFKRFLSR